jgi:hypothetical protein
MGVNPDEARVRTLEVLGGGVEAQYESFQCRKTMEEGKSSSKTFPDCFAVLSDTFLSV